MTYDQHLIASATGVDVSLPIAGPGSRSYAFLIDWHFRLVLAGAWFVCAALLTTGRVVAVAGPGRAPPAYLLTAVLPALLIYFLYHPIVEVLMQGRTPGKRMAGVRIVTRLGGTPPLGALLIRNVFRLVDSMPLLYVVGLITTMLTAQRVRIGDLAAGTILVFDSGDAASSLARVGELAQQSSMDPALLDIALDLLGRWTELDGQRRATLARNLLVRAGDDAERLQSLDDPGLRARLEAALRGEPVAA